MEICDLPAGDRPAPIHYPHFPTRFQAVIFRNWGVIPAARLAAVLRCTEDQVRDCAEEMGLERIIVVNPKWVSHSYLTIIRNNWQLLPYSQILEMLGWSADKMAYTLKEEDFFWTKLGKLKPETEAVHYEPLTEELHKATALLRETIDRYFPAEKRSYVDKPFAFLDRFAPVKSATSGRNRFGFDFNFIHSYSASCGDVLGNAETLDPVPENLLSQYASMGIKGVWIHALLYLLYPISGAEEYSAGHEKRLANLKKIVDRCAKYGLKVYLYLNEPRCMPLPFYEKKPHWGGLDVPANHTKTNCINRTPEVLEYLEDTMEKLFTDVKGLGGAFCITMSENATNCHYSCRAHECPYCSKVPPETIIANVLTAMERGMHKAAPDASMIAYDWAWRRTPSPEEDTLEFKKAVMDLLPESIYVESVSEWGKVTNIGGVKQTLVDYSISQVGPSEDSLRTWQYAQKIGLKVAAKVQMNNSWELSAIPYVPVPYLVQEHLTNLKNAGVKGLMLSWTLGGFPGGNLELLDASPEEIASARYNKLLAEKVCSAWKKFSDAYRNFPFNVTVLYLAPMNSGPMNLLHLEKTHYKATMVGFPYDDLKSWCGPYPEDVFENQFKLLTEGWQEGLKILAESASLVQDAKEKVFFDDLCTIANAGYYHLKSTCNQIRFVRARDNGMDKEVMRECAADELQIAVAMHEIVRNDSRIGFEASNHYYYTLNDLREKALSCARILERLS